MLSGFYATIYKQTSYGCSLKYTSCSNQEQSKVATQHAHLNHSHYVDQWVTKLQVLRKTLLFVVRCWLGDDSS